MQIKYWQTAPRCSSAHLQSYNCTRFNGLAWFMITQDRTHKIGFMAWDTQKNAIKILNFPVSKFCSVGVVVVGSSYTYGAPRE